MSCLREDGLLRQSVSRKVAVGDCTAAPRLLGSAMTCPAEVANLIDEISVDRRVAMTYCSFT